MEKKEYLNEEEYKKNAKKLKTIGLIVLIVGIVILVSSIIMIIVGFLGFGNAASSGFESFGSSNFDSSSFASENSRIARQTTGTMGLFIAGGFLNMLGIMATFAGAIILFIAHRREIAAFTTQQVMPLAQEGIDKMTPTVSDAAGSVAKSISKGIVEGKKEAEIDKDVL